MPAYTCDCGRQKRGSGVVVEILLYRVVMPEALLVKPPLDGLRQRFRSYDVAGPMWAI